MKLTDNVVFITGGASGIGFALAKGFLELNLG
jgi:short-subunit dehydrogenase involved in D-alanine esterification of teichoic acids